MPFGQLNVAIQIYNICKGRLGSRGGKGSYKRKKTSNILQNKPLCKMVVFIVHQLYINSFTVHSVVPCLMVWFPYLLLINKHS